jgi:hypothetical protein
MNNQITIIDIGDEVICDDCGKVWTPTDTAEGGLSSQSRAICPDCAPQWAASAKKYGEEKFISGRQRAGETFHAYVMRIRDGDNTVVIQTFDNNEDFFAAMEGPKPGRERDHDDYNDPKL